MDNRKKRPDAVLHLKDASVDDVLAMSNAQLLKLATDEGIVVDEVRSRIMGEVELAVEAVNAKRMPRVAQIDAGKARAILRRVAARARGANTPLQMAASLEGTLADEKVLDLLKSLRDKKAISDDDLK